MPVCLGGGGSVQEQVVFVAKDRHAHLVVRHALSQIRPDVIVFLLVFHVAAGSELHHESDGKHERGPFIGGTFFGGR